MTIETTVHRESRLAKLKALQDKGYNPYPYRFRPDAFAADLQEKYKELEPGADTEDRVTVAGRAMAVRNNGMFIDIKDIRRAANSRLPPKSLTSFQNRCSRCRRNSTA